MPQAGFPRSGGVKQLAKLCESINSQHFANWIERSRLSRLVSASPAAAPRSAVPPIGFYLPVDAMVEFYFENWDAFNCFYASEEFKRLSAHGAGFIGSIDTYLVQSHTVVEHPSDGGCWL